ncbi:Uncharacterised protein g9014 [Pycnogonum litorale]
MSERSKVLFYLPNITDVDGYLARKWNQVSAFGALLDVVVDNVNRGLLWSYVVPKYGYLISSLEWITLVCTHTIGPDWKNVQQMPRILSKIVGNGFKDPLGSYVIHSLDLLPLWIYVVQNASGNIVPAYVRISVTAFLTIGRGLAASVEVWFITTHLRRLLDGE